MQRIYVSDNSERDFIADDMDPGPLDDIGDMVVRERRDMAQDNLQIRTFLAFDLAALTADDVASASFSATLSVDFVTQLNTVNDMRVLVGRVVDDGVDGDAWGIYDGDLPLYEWARIDGGIDLDGDVDLDDFGQFKVFLPEVAAMATVQSLPEPNGRGLAAAALAGLLTVRPRTKPTIYIT